MERKDKSWLAGKLSFFSYCCFRSRVANFLSFLIVLFAVEGYEKFIYCYVLFFSYCCIRPSIAIVVPQLS